MRSSKHGDQCPCMQVGYPGRIYYCHVLLMTAHSWLLIWENTWMPSLVDKVRWHLMQRACLSSPLMSLPFLMSVMLSQSKTSCFPVAMVEICSDLTSTIIPSLVASQVNWTRTWKNFSKLKSSTLSTYRPCAAAWILMSAKNCWQRCACS